MMATGGGGGYARGMYAEREDSPSIAELVMDAMVYTAGYDSDSGEMIGRFSPRMAFHNMGVDEEYADYFGEDSDYSDEMPDLHDEGPAWEGGGYDYQFVSEVPSTLQCLICTTAAREAQQVDCCGKVFCKSCLRKLKRGLRKACPNCRKTKWKSFSDKKSK